MTNTPTKWKPKAGQFYWFVYVIHGVFGNALGVMRIENVESLHDAKAQRIGNCYPTRKEAQAALKRVKEALRTPKI